MNTKILFTEVSIDNSKQDIEALREFVKNNGFLVLFVDADSDITIARKISEGFDNSVLKHIYIFKENYSGCTLDRYGTADCLNFGTSSLLKSDFQRAKEKAIVTENMIARFKQQGRSNLDIYAFSSNLAKDLPAIATVAHSGGEIGLTNVISSAGIPLIKESEMMESFLRFSTSDIEKEQQKCDTSRKKTMLIDSKSRLEQIKKETDEFYDMLFDNYPVIEESQYRSLSEFIKIMILNSKGLRKVS